jgi:nucleotide-binding universal stress UspA family protein
VIRGLQETNMYRNVLVPLDGSPFAEQALPLALSIARRSGAALHLARAHVPGAPLYTGSELVSDFTLDAAIREQETTYLAELVKRVTSAAAVMSAASVTPAALLIDGPVADAIHEHALAAGADLVVMATHGRGPLSRFWLGSVADQLIRKLPMPILLVRPHDSEADLAADVVLKWILIPLDGSELAEQILAPAIALGTLMHAKYLLLSVIEPVILPDVRLAGNAVGGADFKLLKKIHDETQAYLDRVAQRLRGQSLHVQTRVIVNRPAAAAILEEAHTRAIDLIASETHGRGGLTRMLLGSVADKVVRGATRAVLVQRPMVGK